MFKNESAMPSSAAHTFALPTALLTLGRFQPVTLRPLSDLSSLHLQPFQLLSPERKKRVFFAYEKRLRELSSPDKVFDYFASDQDPSGARWGPWTCSALL
jgi:hypothetical protein